MKIFVVDFLSPNLLIISYNNDSGVIISQNWPSGTTQQSFECVWELQTDPSKAFHINFMDIDLGVLKIYSGSYCTDTLTFEGKHDFLIIYKNNLKSNGNSIFQ